MIGKKLIELRTNRKMTKSEIAKILNMTPSSYGDYEREVSRPSYETLIELAKLFNVSVNYLIDNEKEDTKEIIFSKEEVSKILDVVQILNEKLK